MEPTRKQRLVEARRPIVAPGQNIPITVSQKIAKDTKRPVGLTQDEKMLCGLRKVLTLLSDQNKEGQRFYIAGATINVTKRTASPGAKAGEPGTYRAEGTFELGIIHPPGAGVSFKQASFNIHFRDSKDAMGLRDVIVEDDTTLDMQ